jgi:putative transposase
LENIFVSLGVLCQAFYGPLRQEQKSSIADIIVLCLVRELQTIMQMFGARKLLYELQLPLKQHGVKMGRDQLFEY